MQTTTRMPIWSILWPVAGTLLLAAVYSLNASALLATMSGFFLFAVVFAAVYHAEIIAHKVGEPFGTLVLAIAVTVIEVALIVSLLITGPEKVTLARDTVFAAVMIICNGLIGICLLAGGLRHKEQVFQLQGALAALAVLVALTVITLLLPNYTVSEKGPLFNNAQMIFAGVCSLVLYGSFVFVQTVRHRDYFLPDVDVADEDTHAAPPTTKMTFGSLGLLLVSLIVVVGLAKSISPIIEDGVEKIGVSNAIVGIIIAMLVLLPESVAALRAARANRLQTSMNLALGSALATIGLTIPAVVFISMYMEMDLVLGLGQKEGILLGLTLLASTMTIGSGRTTVLQGIVHLVIFATFLFLTIVP